MLYCNAYSHSAGTYVCMKIHLSAPILYLDLSVLTAAARPRPRSCPPSNNSMTHNHDTLRLNLRRRLSEPSPTKRAHAAPVFHAFIFNAGQRMPAQASVGAVSTATGWI